MRERFFTTDGKPFFQKKRKSKKKEPSKVNLCKKRVLYHVTEPENVESILQRGLIPGGDKRRAFAVYLSRRPKSWYTEGKVILRVYVGGLKIPISTFEPVSDEVLYWGTIPSDRISIYRKKEKDHGQNS